MSVRCRGTTQYPQPTVLYMPCGCPVPVLWLASIVGYGRHGGRERERERERERDRERERYRVRERERERVREKESERG